MQRKNLGLLGREAVETAGKIRPLRIAEIVRAAVSGLVLTGSQTGLARFVAASTTTETFVAQEMVKPNPPGCTPKPGPLFRICGFGRNHGAVGRPSNIAPQPVVPGR